MKNRTILLPLLMLFMCPVVSGCNSSNENTPSIEEVNISLNETSKKMIYGSTFKLIVSFSGGTSKQVEYYSVNEAIAKVSPTGLVTACGIGKTIIYATTESGSAKCDIEVVFGDSLPVLNLDTIANDELTIAVGSSFTFSGQVVFEGVSYYPSFEYKNYQSSIIGFTGNTLNALKIGETTLDIKANWNSFDCPSLERHIVVKVIDVIELYAKVTVGEETIITNEINLSITDKWPTLGSSTHDYYNKAYIDVEAVDGNQVKSGTFTIGDESIVKKDGNEITAIGCGSTTITISYTNAAGAIFTNIIYVNVTVPVVDYYLDEYISVKCDSQFPVEEIFGKGATILSASQNGKDLPIRRGKIIQDIVPKGFETSPLTVVTNKGGFVFNKVLAYTDIVTEENFNSIFQLESGKIVDGYYIVDSDISVNAASQTESKYVYGSEYNTYFAGVLDGRGLDGTMHTIHATVGREGMFGGFGDGATVKNIHLNFTFDTNSDGTTKYSCGLSRNAYTYIQNSWVATLENLYVTTTNYGSNTYALMMLRFDHLVMKDIYVKLGGTEEFEDFNNVYSQKWAALFQKDATFIQGPSSQFYAGEFKNIHVVTNKFMPIANDTESQTYLLITYAHNDLKNLGDYKRYSMTSSEIRSCYLTYADENGDNVNLFGHWRGSDNTFFERIAWIYGNRGEDYADEGIRRYDSSSEIGLTKIGSWNV